jgi:hypothetical protein
MGNPYLGVKMGDVATKLRYSRNGWSAQLESKLEIYLDGERIFKPAGSKRP